VFCAPVFSHRPLGIVYHPCCTVFCAPVFSHRPLGIVYHPCCTVFCAPVFSHRPLGIVYHHLDIVSDLSCLATLKRLVKTELYSRAYLRWLMTTHTCDSSLCEWLNVRHQQSNCVIIIIIIIIIICVVLCFVSEFRRVSVLCIRCNRLRGALCWPTEQKPDIWNIHSGH